MILNRNQLADALMKSSINTTDLVVVNMNGNYTLEKLQKKLNNLNYIVNYRLNRYALKKNSKFPRPVAMYCYCQEAFNNTHAHIYLRTEPNYDYAEVVKIIDEEWQKLDTIWRVVKDKFGVVLTERFIKNPYPSFSTYEKQVKTEEAYAMYSVREFTPRDELTYITY